MLPTAKSWRRNLLLLIVAVALLVVWYGISRHRSSDEQTRLAQEALEEGDFATAYRLAEAELIARPGNTTARLIAAEAAENSGHLQAAVSHLNSLPAQFDSYEVYSGWLQLARLQQSLGRVSDARATLQRVVDESAGAVLARQRLAELLAGCGYPWEALAPLHELLVSGDIQEADLFRLAVTGNDRFGRRQLQRLHALNPADPMPVVGLLAAARDERDGAAIEELLADVHSLDSAVIRARLQHSRWTASTGSSDSDLAAADVADRLKHLLAGHAEHPETWMLAGKFARQSGDMAAALQYFAKAVDLHPWHLPALHAAADAARSSDPAISAEFRALAEDLRKIQQMARRIRHGQADPSTCQRLSFALAAIGRQREAVAWARVAVAADTGELWAAELIRQQDFENTWVHPVNHVERTGVRLPTGRPVVEAVASGTDFAATHVMQFRDVTIDVGIDFRYDNGRTSDQAGLFMHQWTGGGVGVLDIDGDTWPDLCFSQGDGPDVQTASSGMHDAICRNIRGREFVDVAAVAMDVLNGFGQGVGIGDVNNDGFDDIYIARLRQNVLLINLGDGTFLPSAELPTSEAWTTSVAIADLNGDSIPDLYNVNYLAGEDVFSRTCDHQGRQRICGPADFPAAADMVLLADGHGAWGDGSKLLLGSQPPQRGMGLVVGDLLHTGCNQVYVANDEAANQLFVPAADGSWSDLALQLGMALNGLGEAQGSMGIAVGDADGNGTADVFVTNYYSESNNLYSQLQPSCFVEAAAAANLAAAGFTMLGFGCQFADIDMDGRQDLFVSNGHLDDFTHKGHPFRMLPQLFHNTASRFDDARPAGDYFDRPLLGRAAAKLDWNRDGRVDFVVTHLDDAVSLIENRCEQAAQSLGVRVVGTVSSRDGVGAVVRRTMAGQTQLQWVTAGDGYQCTNQKLSRFAVRTDTQSDTLSVTWPDSRESSIRLNPVHSLLTVIEGRSAAYGMPR